MSKKSKGFFININGNSRPASLSTLNLFGEISPQSTSSIDWYIKKNKFLLIKIGELETNNLLNINQEEDRDIYNLFLLGFVSNVESYFRRLIREVILIDHHSYKECLEQPLTYAAALHHTDKLLPEALLEQCTFISFENIKNTVKSFLGITISGQATEQKELEECLRMFEQLCHLRHCIVHRAGLLGSRNAIKLGIEEHKFFFEKPIILNSSFLQEASTICLNCVRTFNNFAFNVLIKRHIENEKYNISWNYNKDKKWFNKYFNLFNSEELNKEAIHNSTTYYTAKQVYDETRLHFK
jgi:hypothetical protein